MPLENLKNVANLCSDFAFATCRIDRATRERAFSDEADGEERLYSAVKDLLSAVEPGNPKPSKQLIVYADKKAEMLAKILPQPEVAKLVPAAMKEPENVATLRQVGAKTLAALCVLKP